ncbi:MAG: FAD/NAD(P)-binding oxidoreductase [Longimicrobiales bacterium]|nr:FAD/NAD(P)-binding oxidoreductase [Longimicrobiales bacterium]
MAHYEYLIVGGGMTADAAVRGIRSVDEGGSIGLVSAEPDPPYDRPPLSKGLWTGQDEEGIWRETEDEGVDLHLDRRITRIDREERTATDDRGTVYSYGELLLAVGASPRELEDGVPQVNYLRTYRDYLRLRRDAEEKKSFAVIGGGFIGSEIAASLAVNDNEVVLLFPEEGICDRVLPPDLSRHLNGYFRDRGVDVRSESMVTSVRRSGDEFLIAVEGSEEPALRVDSVVAGLGVEPRIMLAETSGLETEDGIVVDASFQTGDPHIYSAGDCAAFWSPVLGKRLRIEHEDHANSSGMHAGRAMAGELVQYDYLPFFYSDLFDLGYEAVGELNAAGMDLATDWSGGEFEEGAVYYLRDGRVRGVLLWNLRGKLKDARSLIQERRRMTTEDLAGALTG